MLRDNVRALPSASHNNIELQCIFVETLLTEKVSFRDDHVLTALISTPHQKSIRWGKKDERRSWNITCMVTDTQTVAGCRFGLIFCWT